jgi:hypothetical protein
MIATIEPSVAKSKSKVKRVPSRTVFDGRLFLKVKLKSLAAEARIIRDEEKKNPLFHQALREHRIGIVRNEARHTQLAYGFLRGLSYRQIEPKAHQKPDWVKVEKMVQKYGRVHLATVPIPWQGREQLDKEVMERFQKWKADAMR